MEDWMLNLFRPGVVGEYFTCEIAKINSNTKDYEVIGQITSEGDDTTSFVITCIEHGTHHHKQLTEMYFENAWVSFM